MINYIAMLRGINVSGQKKVPMAELRKVLSGKGLENLATYIQSGNLVFKSNLNKDTIPNTIRETIKSHFGFEVPTLLLTVEELNSVVGQNPFSSQDITKLHITFLASTPGGELIESLPRSPNPREDYFIRDRVIYVYCPDGYGRTKIHNNFFEKKLKVTATTRNWKTCLKLQDMAQTL